MHSYANYHQGDRAEMLRLLPPEVRSLLDVGGGQGGFASAFAARTGGRAVLVEAHPAAAAAARVRGVETICEAFEAATIARGFDCVSFLDVLEHLPDPLAALRKAHSVLVDGGRLLLSVPNVGHWSVVRDLIEGEFDYQPVGILCNTHLRFFTRRSLERLLADAGFRVERWEDVPPPPAGPSAQPAAAALPADLARLLGERGGAPIVPDARSLATESFHVLARRD